MIDYDILRDNLLQLTRAVALKYGQYESPFFTSRAYRQYENELIDEIALNYHETARNVFVDLGCATGSQVKRMMRHFELGYGFDVSQEMIDVANSQLSLEIAPRVIFRQADLEGRIPLETGSVSFLTMSMGTASDIRNFPGLLREIQRVLRRAGKFLLSFYNRNALVYNWNHLPWPTSMAAEMDHEKQILKVHVDNQVFEIYAHSYTAEEVTKLMPERLKIQQVFTYPAVSSILPESAFNEGRASSAILELDRNLSDKQYGAYLIVIGERSMFD